MIHNAHSNGLPLKISGLLTFVFPRPEKSSRRKSGPRFYAHPAIFPSERPNIIPGRRASIIHGNKARTSNSDRVASPKTAGREITTPSSANPSTYCFPWHLHEMPLKLHSISILKLMRGASFSSRGILPLGVLKDPRQGMSVRYCVGCVLWR